jgi:ribonuclease HI
MTPKKPVHRGAGLFGEPPETKPVALQLPAWRANIDGGSRGNPGPASYGVVIRDPRGEIVARLKKYIGRTSNNVAEYYGLIAALDYAQSNHVRALRIESDSELMVKQMRGQYKVKSADLKPLFERAKKMSQAIPAFRIDHVYREQNKEADALANEAMDEADGKAPAGEKRFSKIENGKVKMETRTSTGAPNPTIRVRARFRSGILYPLEDVDLPDGAEVEILLRPTKPQ